MRIVVFGANGGVGRRAVEAAAGGGHQVVAAAVPVGAVPAVVDVRDAAAVRLAVTGADAVLWCVGVTKRSGSGVGAEGLAHLLARSTVAWTEVRPPRLVDTDAPQEAELVEQAPGLTAKPVSKRAVARTMLELAGSANWVRRSPFLVAR